MTPHPRPYTDNDLPQLQEALARWIAVAGGCGYFHVGNLPHWIYEILRGREPLGELVQVWQDGPTIMGLTVAGLFGTTFQALLDPSLRGGPAEVLMLRSASHTTRRFMAAGDDLLVGTDVFGCDSVRRQLLTQLGFVEYRVWDAITERELSSPIPDASLPEGFVIRSATIEDAEQLAFARNDAFGGDWTPELYRSEVMGKPGYWPEQEIVVVSPDNRIAAFTTIRFDPHNRIGQFEPVGTVRAFQRRGLARAMLLHALGAMQRAGMTTASVSYDATNRPAHGLYSSLGFVQRYETLGYQLAS